MTEQPQEYRTHDERRWAMVRITPGAVVQLASGMLRVSYPGQIPAGARVIGQAWAPLLQMFELIIEHESFDRVPVGAEAPALPLLTFEIDAAGNSAPGESDASETGS